MIDILFVTGIALIFQIFIGILYFNAEKFYNAQNSLRKMDKAYFFILGSGSKDLDNREKWIKNYKRNILMMSILIISIVISMAIGVSAV
jgi:hypothetical protein